MSTSSRALLTNSTTVLMTSNDDHDHGNDDVNDYDFSRDEDDENDDLCNRGVWGSHLGSETLLRRHAKSRRRIACISESFSSF